MTLKIEEGVNQFFVDISSFIPAYEHQVFNFIALRRDNKWKIIQARLFLNLGAANNYREKFVSNEICAYSYHLKDLNLRPKSLVERLLRGGLTTPDGEFIFPASQFGNYNVQYIPHHPDALKVQNRLSVLQIVGLEHFENLSIPKVDWELRSANTPYDSLLELAVDFYLGALKQDAVNFEAAAFSVLAIDASSTVGNDNADIKVRLAPNLNTDLVKVGYRALIRGTVLKRDSLESERFSWTIGNDYQAGIAKIQLPEGAVVHCYASYNGILQHHYWIGNPNANLNPRLAILETIDHAQTNLKSLLGFSPLKGFQSRDFETGIAWLLWLLGFSVIHFGKNQESNVDLIALTEGGDVAVIECTIGLLNNGNKLSKLLDRTAQIKKSLDESNNKHLNVLPVIITTKSREEVYGDIEFAERHGISIITQENLLNGLQRSKMYPAANQMYVDAQKDREIALQKYSEAIFSTTLIE